MNAYLKKPYILFLIVAIGVLIAMILVKNRAPLQHDDTAMPSRAVDIIQVTRLPYRAKVTAYGNVEPAVTLKSLAEVSGKISYLHPQLRRGNTLPGGTLALRIDPEDYEVGLKQTQADLAANQASLEQLQSEERSTLRSLDLAQANLEVGEQELARIRDIWERKLVARSTLDAEEQKVIQWRQQVEELKGKLDSYASLKNSVEAKITRARQQVKGQQTTLGRTEITLPFTSRIGEVSVEKGQFVNVGGPLFEALDVDGVEINAQVPIQHMRSLVTGPLDMQFKARTTGDTSALLAELNLSAHVRLVGNIPDAQWDAKVLRFSEAVDPVRRTLGVVVGVDAPYEKMIPGHRPPLLKGMFMAVELYAPARSALIIPREALHHGRVYLVDADGRLAIRPVRLQQQQDDLAVVAEGLNAGEQLIVSELMPVIEGMPLTPRRSLEIEQELSDRASGR